MSKFGKFIEKYHRQFVYAVVALGLIFAGFIMFTSTSTPPDEKQKSNQKQDRRSLISPLNPMNPVSPFFPGPKP